MLWTLLAAFHLVSTDVIRDDGFYDYEGQFTVTNKGRMLRVLMYFNNIQQEECALHCVRHLRCSTFNYHSVKKACELTDEDFDETDADKISIGWYNHGTPPKVNGGWSSWKNFTECTKTCEGGTLEQWRDCDSPKPEHGGIDCQGRMRRTVKCNTNECPVVNVAFKKTATQSSLNLDNPLYAASNAVDGDINTQAITKYEDNQWWLVDLGEIRQIKYIQVDVYVWSDTTNKGLIVETRKNKVDSWILCKDLGVLREEITNFKCKDQLIKARFLRIRSTENSLLDFKEVEIYGY